MGKWKWSSKLWIDFNGLVDQHPPCCCYVGYTWITTMLGSILLNQNTELIGFSLVSFLFFCFVLLFFLLTATEMPVSKQGCLYTGLAQDYIRLHQTWLKIVNNMFTSHEKQSDGVYLLQLEESKSTWPISLCWDNNKTGLFVAWFVCVCSFKALKIKLSFFTGIKQHFQLGNSLVTFRLTQGVQGGQPVKE